MIWQRVGVIDGMRALTVALDSLPDAPGGTGLTF
jgi:hypothetical protein